MNHHGAGTLFDIKSGSLLKRRKRNTINEDQTKTAKPAITASDCFANKRVSFTGRNIEHLQYLKKDNKFMPRTRKSLLVVQERKTAAIAFYYISANYGDSLLKIELYCIYTELQIGPTA